MDHELVVLGTCIGSCNGWDQVDDQALIFYNYHPNETGSKFCRGVVIPEGVDIAINFETGNVELSSSNSRLTMPAINPDWSVFNKTPAP